MKKLNNSISVSLSETIIKFYFFKKSKGCGNSISEFIHMYMSL